MRTEEIIVWLETISESLVWKIYRSGGVRFLVIVINNHFSFLLHHHIIKVRWFCLLMLMTLLLQEMMTEVSMSWMLHTMKLSYQGSWHLTIFSRYWGVEKWFTYLKRNIFSICYQELWCWDASRQMLQWI